MTEENGVEAPDQQEQFAQVLHSHRVKPDDAQTVSRYVADSSQGAVFEDPEELAKKLAEFHDLIDPVRRRRIVKHWFSKRGVDVPDEVLRRSTQGDSPGKREAPV